METKYVVVYTGNGQLDAEMVRLFLQSEGIEGFITQESAGTTFGLTVGTLGEARVLVPADKAELARKLLDEMEEGRFLQDDDTGSDEDGQDDEEASEEE